MYLGEYMSDAMDDSGSAVSKYAYFMNIVTDLRIQEKQRVSYTNQPVIQSRVLGQVNYIHLIGAIPLCYINIVVY